MTDRGAGRGWVWWAALLVAISLAARGFALWLAGDRVPLGDPFVYESLARNLLAGRGLVSDEILELPGLRAFYPPGYPWLLAIAGLVLPLGAATYVLINTAIDAVAALLIAKVGAEAGDARGGRIAGFAYFAWPTNIFMAPLAYKEGLAALLVLAAILALFAAARGRQARDHRLRHRHRRAGAGPAGAGHARARCSASRSAPNFATGRAGRKSMAVAAEVAVLVLLPWWIRNFILFDRFIPFTTAGGLGLWIGATPLGSGSWVRPPAELLAGGELQAASALGAEAWRIIAADPARYISHCLAKLPLGLRHQRASARPVAGDAADRAQGADPQA